MSVLTEKFCTVVKRLFQISGFLREVDETCVLLSYYAACSGNSFYSFGTADWANLPGSRIHLLVFLTFKVGTDVDS
jgi:hypothetical protein